MLPGAESKVDLLVRMVNMRHRMKGRIEWMGPVHHVPYDGPEEDRFEIRICYDPVPYADEHEYAEFESDMEQELQANAANWIMLAVDVTVWPCDEEEASEEPGGND